MKKSKSNKSVTKPFPGETYDLEALKRRDPAALDGLVRQESDRVYRCVRRILRDDDEAQSLTQETFLQALLKLDTFRGDSKLSTWLCAIAINLARASLRKSVRYDVLEEQEIERLQPNFTPGGAHIDRFSAWSPERALERSELHDIVHAAIDRLPDTYRTVLILRDIQEFSSAETAQMLDITEGAMRVRLHRARQALRALLHDQILNR